MISEDIIIFSKKTIKRRSFILLIIIWSIVIYAVSIILAIPAIISLILYKQDKNLKHSFHRFFLIWTLFITSCLLIFLWGFQIIVGICTLLLLIHPQATTSHVVAYAVYFCVVSILLFLNLCYLVLVVRFKKVIEEEQEVVEKKIGFYNEP